MAGFTFSIGSHTFLSLEGNLGLYQDQIEILNLAYKDGSALRSMGQRSEPFVLTSCVDLENEVLAYEKADAYKLLVSAGNQVLVWRSVNLSTAASLTNKWKVNVIKVSSPRVIKAYNIVGGLNRTAGQNGVMLYCDWTLQLVPFS